MPMWSWHSGERERDKRTNKEVLPDTDTCYRDISRGVPWGGGTGETP